MLRAFLADSFACEYVPSCAALTTIARAIVGVAPLQSVSTPSSRLKNHVTVSLFFATVSEVIR